MFHTNDLQMLTHSLMWSLSDKNRFYSYCFNHYFFVEFPTKILMHPKTWYGSYGEYQKSDLPFKGVKNIENLFMQISIQFKWTSDHYWNNPLWKMTRIELIEFLNKIYRKKNNNKRLKK